MTLRVDGSNTVTVETAVGARLGAALPDAVVGGTVDGGGGTNCHDHELVSSQPWVDHCCCTMFVDSELAQADAI